MLFNVVNEKDPRIRITILRPSGIATGSAAPQTTDSFDSTPNSSALCHLQTLAVPHRPMADDKVATSSTTSGVLTFSLAVHQGTVRASWQLETRGGGFESSV